MGHVRTLAAIITVAALVGCGDGGGANEEGTDGSDGSGDPSGGPDGGPASSSASSSTGISTTDAATDGDSSGDPSGDPTGDPTGDPDPTPGGDCSPLPPPSGEVIELGPSDDLPAAIANATTGTTLMLADGTYDVSGANYIVFATDGVTLRSHSGDPEAVIIDGGYGIGEVFSINADDITIAEVTVARALYHPIHVTGGGDSNTERTTIYRVRVVDPGQQAIKINASEGTYADFGTVACSHIELTAAGRPHVTDCYTGGIDAHLAEGWVVRDNTIVGFWCEAGLSEHGVHFWNSGKDTVVERNTIVDCARGVGFGLGEGGNGTARDYDGDPCPGVTGFVGHYGGLVRNNMIVGRDPAMFASQFGMDSGIALEQACGAVVSHNTVIATEPPFVSVEYRFANTQATIANNLVTHTITPRDGGNAELLGNIADAGLAHFVDPAAADAHLVAGSAAIDAGVPEPGGGAADDFDGDARDGSPDVGADEWAR